MAFDFALSQSVTQQAKAFGIFLLVGFAVGIVNVVIKIIKTRFAQKTWSSYVIDFLRVIIDGLSFALSQYVFFDFDMQAFHIGVYALSAVLTYRIIYLHLLPTLKKFIYTKRTK